MAEDRSSWPDWRLAEQAEATYMAGFGAPAAAAARSDVGMTVTAVGGGVVWALRGDPTGFFCRAVGLGVHQPVTAEVLDEVVTVASDAGAPVVAVQLAPEVLSPDVVALLADRGFAASRTWDKLLRDTADPPEAETDLRVEVVGPDRADEFAGVVLQGFGMPPMLAPLVAAEVSLPGWTAYGAFDGDTMVSAAAMAVDGDLACFSGAATLESHRGRGAQRAFMTRRLTDAAAAGVRTVGTETWSETSEAKNPSLHNMHWAGFRTVYQRVNHVRRLG